jgi:hypothetical protein
MDAFCAFIAGKEYGPDETPESIGLYGGCYSIVFTQVSCGELCLQRLSKLTHSVFSYQGLITCTVRSRTTCCWWNTIRGRAR